MVKKAAYKSPQSMGKAISKCLKKLPCSLTKKKAVVPGIMNKIGLKVQQKWMILSWRNQKLTAYLIFPNISRMYDFPSKFFLKLKTHT